MRRFGQTLTLALALAWLSTAPSAGELVVAAGDPAPATSDTKSKEPPFAPLSKIAGVALACTDVRGAPVSTVQVTNLGDVGRAWLVSRVPLIAVDPHILRTLPGKLQLFFYGHECAHHVLGHSYTFSSTMESDADCWSIKDGRDRSLFTRDDVVNFAPWLMKSTGSPWGHLPGPERSRHLLKCFDEP